MKEINLHIKLAQDGSGYSLYEEHGQRKAFLRDDSSDRTNVIVPLTEKEENAFSHNIVEENGVRGLLVTNVNDADFETLEEN